MSAEKNKKKKDSKPLLIVIIAILLVMAVVAGIVIINLLTQKPQEEEEEKEERKGVVGVVTDDWDDGVEEPTSQQSGTRIPGYSYAEMDAGDTDLVIRIGNPKENKVGFFATLKLEDGTVLYESGLLKPGQGLEAVPLNRTLEKGVYDAVVRYQCVLLDDENTPLNAAESAFKLYVN